MKQGLIGFVAGLVVACAAAGLALWWGWETHGRTAYETWPVVEFTPACEHYEPNAGDYISKLKFLEGTLTEEFWAMAAKKLDKYTKSTLVDAENVTLRKGKIHTPLVEYYHSNAYGKKFEGQREEWFMWVTSEVAKIILQRRKAEGLFTADDQKEFMVFRDRWNMHVPMAINECGFVEELIMKGGRFAVE